jgi:hypothetical protein
MPYEPRQGATVKENLFDPWNMAISFIAGIGLGLFLELLIRIFSLVFHLLIEW